MKDLPSGPLGHRLIAHPFNRATQGPHITFYGQLNARLKALWCRTGNAPPSNLCLYI